MRLFSHPDRWAVLAALFLLAGCGGGSGSGPGLGSGFTVNVRGLNLVAGSAALTVTEGPYGHVVGSAAALQATGYSSVSGGVGSVQFADSAGTLATFGGELPDSTFNTVAIYSVNGNYSTFGLEDNGGITAPTRSQLRIADADSTVGGDIDVFLNAGSFSQPVTTSSSLITPNGLALGHATSYQVLNPGTYTVTVVSALDQSALILNQVVTIQGGQAQTLYVVSGNTSATTMDNQ